MLFLENYVKWFMWMLKISKKIFNLINWILISKNDLKILTPKINFVKH
jgi:hypothetical protein